MEVTITLSDPVISALGRSLAKLNAEIDATNRIIQAEKDLAAANGNEYQGPEPSVPLTMQSYAQLLFDDNVGNEAVRAHTRTIALDISEMYVAADPATQAQMMADLAKYRPAPNAPDAPDEPVARVRVKGDSAITPRRTRGII